MKTMNKWNQIKKAYHKGILTEQETKREAEMLFYEELLEFLQEIKITNENYHNFLEDHERWKQNKYKHDFFEWIENLCIPMEYFEPIPTSIKRPTYSWPEMANYKIFYDVIEDDGFFKDLDPVGKTFHFKDKNNLSSMITILPRKDQHSEFSDIGYFQYLGMGTVEGYTSNDPQEMAILIDAKDPSLFTFVLDGKKDENRNTIYNFPLWDEYWKWMNNREEMEQKIIEQVLKNEA